MLTRPIQVLPEKINYEELVKQDVNKIKELGIKDDKLAELIDLYYRVDFEDIIAGGIKTRFKVSRLILFHSKQLMTFT